MLAAGIPAVGWWQHSQGIVVHARMAETGGWTPENLTVAVGEPLQLQLTSDDVTHSFAVGLLDQPAVDVMPGEITNLSLVFDKPGKYTFYCTRWCSGNHWRMRGTIEVTSLQASNEPVKPPLYISLGLNLDADHQAGSTPAETPSAWRGALLNREIPDQYKSREYYLAHTPIDLWLSLKSDPSFHDLTDQDVWNLVAWVWQSDTRPEEIQTGRELYATNCAACHGENGTGNGVFADQLAPNPDMDASEQTMGTQTKRPADFTDLSRMLSVSPAHLQGKILRGGMGTGMPYWGPIFTEEQTWALVAYVMTFPFQLEVEP